MIVGLFVLILVLMMRISKVSVQGLKEGQIDQSKYCVIDIRDFIISNRTPVEAAENIPLSYLGRKSKQQELCDKDILFISEDYKSAKLAARILRRSAKQHRGFYYTVV